MTFNCDPRTTVTIKAENEQKADIVAFGDDVARKESEKLAALCALYQLDSRGQVRNVSCSCHVFGTIMNRISVGDLQEKGSESYNPGDLCTSTSHIIGWKYPRV